MFSHILRCGVIDALPEHQKDWLDDTMLYLADRYEDLSEEELSQLRVLGERFSQPVQRKAEAGRDGRRLSRCCKTQRPGSFPGALCLQRTRYHQSENQRQR